jgi:hypothetical protein
VRRGGRQAALSIGAEVGYNARWRASALRTIAACALAFMLAVPWDVSAADTLPNFMQQHGSGAALTPGEWCAMALLSMESLYTKDRTRIAISEMARNRGCHEAPQYQPDH